MAAKQTVVIIGNGWGGFTVAHGLLTSKYNIAVIAPIRTIQYTPLLASAAAAHFDFRLAEEPVRRRNRMPELRYHKANVEDIDFDKRLVHCRPAIANIAGNDFSNKDRSCFTVNYDKLVIAPGCINQTFGTPGALEHANFLRTTNDARLIQQRILEMLDAASVPGLTDAQQRDILRIIIVGGGPIGIEAAAELFDLWNDDMKYLYAHLQGKFSIEIHDVAEKLLGSFEGKLGEYAEDKLKKRGIEIQTESHIEKVEADAIYTKELGQIRYGLLLWATGNGANPLVEKLESVKKTDKLPRILTDKRLRVLQKENDQVMENVFALGDSADIDGNSLPMLAEVAVQKAEWLTKALNNDGGESPKPFEYKQKASLAYLGGQDGVADGEWTGQSAWLAWRSGSIWHWPRSWRRTLMIGISWIFNVVGGRDIARKW
ncbi:putative NADH dehydrogenase [Sphaerulina musiva]